MLYFQSRAFFYARDIYINVIDISCGIQIRDIRVIQTVFRQVAHCGLEILADVTVLYGERIFDRVINAIAHSSRVTKRGNQKNQNKQENQSGKNIDKQPPDRFWVKQLCIN